MCELNPLSRSANNMFLSLDDAGGRSRWGWLNTLLYGNDVRYRDRTSHSAFSRHIPHKRICAPYYHIRIHAYISTAVNMRSNKWAYIRPGGVQLEPEHIGRDWFTKSIRHPPSKCLWFVSLFGCFDVFHLAVERFCSMALLPRIKLGIAGMCPCARSIVTDVLHWTSALTTDTLCFGQLWLPRVHLCWNAGQKNGHFFLYSFIYIPAIHNSNK